MEYLFFKCTYLEDGIHPEYIFDSAHLDKKTAEEVMKKDKSFFSMYNKIVTKDKLFWNEKYNSWTNVGAFMSVTNDEIAESIKKIEK